MVLHAQEVPSGIQWWGWLFVSHYWWELGFASTQGHRGYHEAGVWFDGDAQPFTIVVSQ